MTITYAAGKRKQHLVAGYFGKPDGSPVTRRGENSSLLAHLTLCLCLMSSAHIQCHSHVT